MSRNIQEPGEEGRRDWSSPLDQGGDDQIRLLKVDFLFIEAQGSGEHRRTTGFVCGAPPLSRVQFLSIYHNRIWYDCLS